MIQPGYCMICNAKTHTQCGTCGTKKFNDQHTEVEVKWSNGSKMRVGVCVDCAKNNLHDLSENKKKIGDAHHDHWQGKSDRSVTIV